MVKLDLVVKAIEEKKGEEVKVYDVELTSPLCSFIVVATMINGRNGKAIAEELEEIQEKLGQRVRSISGGEKDSWILIDLDDIIVHLFTSEERSRVNIEQLLEKNVRG